MGIMEKKMETPIMGYLRYRIRGIWGFYYSIPKATFYLLKGGYSDYSLLCETQMRLVSCRKIL